MQLPFVSDLNKQLPEMDKVFKATIEPWWEETYPYYQQMQEETIWKALPPVTTAAFEYLGCGHQSVTFANIFRIAYFANFIHATVKDEEEGQQHNRELQFSILIGDFLFGRLLKLLVEADHKRIMLPFAAMICTINEGRVMKHKMNAVTEQAVEKIYAPFYEMIFLSAGFLANKDREFRDLYRQLGFNLGMAIELCNYPALAEQAYKYIAAALGQFKQINQRYHLSNSRLENMISEISHFLPETGAAAVI